MSLMEISKSIPQNLDYSERNQILPKNDTQKFGNRQKNDTQNSWNGHERYPKIWEQPQESTQNNGTFLYRNICKLPPLPPRFIQLVYCIIIYLLLLNCGWLLIREVQWFYWTQELLVPAVNIILDAFFWEIPADILLALLAQRLAK